MSGDQTLSLSFDNGPTPGITDRVLEVLDRSNVKATFFVIGDRLRDPAAARLLDKIGETGHRIGNHTLSHSVAFGERLDERYARNEIEDAQALIGHWIDLRTETCAKEISNSSRV
jgi:peptidoglycan-N-acetylglucosamine deacetylase